jgi:hypothetical protein
MMQLLKLIIASERPDLINPQTYMLKEEPAQTKLEAGGLSPQERELIEKLKQLPAAEQQKVYSIIFVLLKTLGGENSKRYKK